MSGRPPRFSVGRMRHRITVQTATETQDDSGQTTRTWSDWLTNEPAEFTETGGGMRLRGQQVEEGIDAVFTVRWRDGHSVENRVVFDGVTYGIVRKPLVGGRIRYMDLHCKAICE